MVGNTTLKKLAVMRRLSGGTRSVCSIKANALQLYNYAVTCEFLEVHLVFVQKKLNALQLFFALYLAIWYTRHVF